MHHIVPSDLLIGPYPLELSGETAFRIFPIAHQYDMRTLVVWCGKAIDRAQLDLWPSAPIASSQVPEYPGLVQWLALADSLHCVPVVESCLSRLLNRDSDDTIRGVLASPHLRKLMDGLHSETKTGIMCRMAGLPLGFQVSLFTALGSLYHYMG